MFNMNDCLVYITCNKAKQLSDMFNEKLMEFGISKVQWSVLYLLGFDENMSVCELANKLEVKHSSATRLLGRMENEEYLIRVKDNKDKRVTHLRLTKKGIAIRNKVLPVCEELSIKAIRDISDMDIKKYKEVLDKLLENIESY